MKITDEAVEAAAIGIYSVVQAAHAKEKGWGDMLPAWQATFRTEARAALEAAMPHLLAAATYAPQVYDCTCTGPCDHPRTTK